MIFELDQPVKVSDERSKISAQQCHREALRETINQCHYTRKGQSKQRGNSQVERDCRNDTRQLDERANDDVAVIIVVDVAASKPRIIGRHRGTAQDGVEKSKFHWFFPAQIDMPEIRV